MSNSLQPWSAACQASLSFTLSLSWLKLMSIESVMTSNHLVLCRPLLHLPSIFPGIRVCSNELALHFRWPKYWSFGFNINPSSEHSLISFRTGRISLQSKGFSKVFSNESILHMRCPKYWRFSFRIIPSKEIPGLIFRMEWLDLLAVQGTLKSLLQHHSSKASILWCSAFFTVQLSHPYMTT